MLNVFLDDTPIDLLGRSEGARHGLRFGGRRTWNSLPTCCTVAML